MYISIVIPVYNEERNIPILHKELHDVLSAFGRNYEVIFINDGSTDKTIANLRSLSERDPHVKVITLSRNFGQTAAMAAGFHYAQGDIIITMDGDLQNDPRDIPRFIEELDKGYDIVSGWRKKRKDSLIRVIPSRTANALISKVLGVPLHDYGCTLKAFRKEVIKGINLYGEMHRFIPAVASWDGARIQEIVVNHRPRRYEDSKYGIKRTGRVFLDLLLMAFLSEYSTKPIRFFGGLAMLNFACSLASLAGLLLMKFVKGTDMTGNPLLILTALFALVGIQLLSIGFISEINIRTYYESQKKTIYRVKDVLGN